LGDVDVDEVLITTPLAVAVLIAVIAQFLVRKGGGGSGGGRVVVVVVVR